MASKREWKRRAKAADRRAVLTTDAFNEQCEINTKNIRAMGTLQVQYDQAAQAITELTRSPEGMELSGAVSCAWQHRARALERVVERLAGQLEAAELALRKHCADDEALAASEARRSETRRTLGE